jgi:hypothetical protein
MPSKLAGVWSIQNLLDVTAQAAQTRFEYMIRDVVKSAVRIQKVTTYDGKNPGEGITKYVCQSSSYPQYYPYLTKKDSRGRARTYQRTHRHTYDVIIQVNTLSLSQAGVKIRTGANKRYNFYPDKNLIKSKKNPNGKYLSVGDYNIVVNGINPDHFFTQEYLRHADKCLYGKNYTNGPPDTTRNKFQVPFLMKHELRVLITLMEAGIFTK